MDFLYKVFLTIFIDEILVFVPLSVIFFYTIFYTIEKKFSYLTVLVLFLPFFFIFYQYSYLPDFFSSIGQDSLIELNADIGEAIFYLKTFFSFLLDPEIFKRNRFWLLLISSLCTGITIYLLLVLYCKKNNKNILDFNKYLKLSFIFLLLIGFYKIINLTIISFQVGKDLRAFEFEFRKNIDNHEIVRKSTTPLNALVYVGESTSAMNMSLYGYPFNNTPWLDSMKNNEKFLKFNNVFANHTHTTAALLGAFSQCIKQKKENCSTKLKSRGDNLSVIDAINKAEIDTYLYSTQGTLGGHNLGGRLVFNTKKKFFPYEENNKTNNDHLKFLGNRYKSELDDKKFFQKSICENKEIFNNQTSSLTILHSYAGHGQYDGYLGHISKDTKFEYPEYIKEKNFLGKDHKNLRLIKEYDTAIKYIDHSLETVFKCNEINSTNNSYPIIFIYFADHGESPASGRGHDSMRLTYEMLHVPLVIFFNDQAYNLHRDKFEKLKALENKNLTLRFIGDLLIYLFDLDIFDDQKLEAYKSDNFKSLNSKFIVERRILDNSITKLPTMWDYDKKLIQDENLIKLFSKQDTSISLWQLKNFLESRKLSDKKKIRNLVCKHRANSYIEQYKASLSNGCFETDILFLKDKVISAHGIEKDTNLIFDNFLNSNFKKNSVWFDSKNIDKVENCKYAENWLKENSNKFLSILLEIPTRSINNLNNEIWNSCIKRISNIKNIEIAYYMPTNDLLVCSKEKTSEIEKKDCNKKFLDILEFLNKTNIKNITFDYSGYNAINNFSKFSNFKWNIWHINSVESFNKIISDNNDIGIMLVTNNKFANNLN